MKELKEFTIDRSKWRCGGSGANARGFGDTLLLNRENYMCCLGQVSSQLGFDRNALLDCAVPCETNRESVLTEFNDDYAIYDNTSLADKAITINDNDYYTLPEREAKLKELFKEHGYKLKFVGKSVKYK